MKRSLSVFQVLRDCITTLEPAVTELLEVLPDLTPRFEVLLIDAGSTDETFEVARDLARSFPQVRIVRQSLQPSLAASLRKGLSHSQGEVLLVRNEDCQAEIHDLRKMWRLIDQYAAVIGRAAGKQQADQRSWKQRLCDWGLGRPAGEAGGDHSTPLHLMHRQVAERLWTGEIELADMPDRLGRSGYRWTEIEMRRACPTYTEFDRIIAADSSRRAEISRTDAGSPRPSEPKRMRQLDRIKRFAIGE